MCGIAGFFDSSNSAEPAEMETLARRMAETLEHRGPDGGGVWVDANAGVALGHQRLSIIDLSAEGHQPMHSASGRYIISYNGEVYNFGDLRSGLGSRGHSFRGHSDTEVILAAISEFGLDSALQRFVGMFAFALWDREESVLYLVRDRMGIKPLYYGWTGQTLLFGSELKALCAYPSFNAEIDRDALALQLRHNYVSAPYSIYKGVYKLPPGTMMRISMGDRPAPRSYWSVREAAESGLAQPFEGVPEEAADELDTLLREAVKKRMVSDVPLGALLSGGIDSSTVVAMMQSQSERPVRTFTVGFEEDEFNEAAEAKRIAAHLGTDHTELYASPRDAQEVIQRLPTIYDEPFSDSSQIPTVLVSELTRNHVTVALSGDGGDELFFGYNHYALGRDLWKKLGWLPTPVRRWMAGAISLAPTLLLDTSFAWLMPALRRYGRDGKASAKANRFAEILGAETSETMYRAITSHWKDPRSFVIGAGGDPPRFGIEGGLDRLGAFSEQMMYIDAVTYLPDDILTKIDRASMSLALEMRVPILDHRVVEFAWRLPLSMKYRNGQRKWLLKKVLQRYVPEDLYDRPKKGFGVPLGEWLRGPLRDWAEALLDEHRLREEGYFEPRPILDKWREHLSGAQDWRAYLWDILMFQAWLEAQPIGGKVAA